MHETQKKKEIKSEKITDKRVKKTSEAAKYNIREVNKHTPTDEDKIKMILSQVRSKEYVEAISKGDEMVEEDFEILDMVQAHIEEEQKKVVEEKKVDRFLNSISKCYISGCEVHCLYGEFLHYGVFVSEDSFIKNISKMDERLRKGYELYKRNPTCSCIEIYERHFCIIFWNGTSVVVNDSEL